VATSGKSRQARSRGNIRELPSGSLQVRVYGGIDPLTGKRHELTEVIPAGKDASKLAEKARTRMLAEVDDRRAPRTKVPVAELMDRHLELLDVEETTRAGYEGHVRRHIKPLLGHLQVGRINGETLDAFYAELRRCREHCRGKGNVDHHRGRGEHECDARCRPHRCRPMSKSAVRQIHNLLNGAFARAERWRWIGANPARQADPPPPAKANPTPPSPAQAAAIVTAAWTDPWWGMLVWLAMTTGARRGELCSLRWTEIDFATSVIDIDSSIGQIGRRVWEKDTKSHQRRRIVLDPQTLALLRSYLASCANVAAQLGIALPETGFVFSRAPDHSLPIKPDNVTQRYGRMCKRLGWDMHIHQLRHYSATELIAAGVDVRTVAGRLGHSGGGTTTLKVYSAWVGEADQRAAASLIGRLPELIGFDSTSNGAQPLPAPLPRAPAPYELIANDLRGAIRSGAIRPGAAVPTVKDLAERYGVALATAHRAVALLREENLITVSRGKRAVVAARRSAD